jgi:acetyltransferase-like isoleucine patch superfamily enzyme
MSWKTLYINFKFLPWKQAIHLPIFISRNIILKHKTGQIFISGDINKGMIRMGFGDVGIFDKKRSKGILDIQGTLHFNGRAHLGHGCKISVGPQGTLSIGPEFDLTAESAIVCHHSITFGTNCLISWDCLFMDIDFHPIKNSDDKIINNPRSITIGNKVWIGCRCTVLKGSTIADGSVLGAGTGVYGAQLNSENCIYAGNPVHSIKQDIHWDK